MSFIQHYLHMFLVPIIPLLNYVSIILFLRTNKIVLTLLVTFVLVIFPLPEVWLSILLTHSSFGDR